MFGLDGQVKTNGMTNIIIVLAIIGGFLFWKRNKSIVPSTLSETSQYLRLLLLPLGQLAICGIILFFAYMGEDVLLSKSPFMEDTIRQNLGMLSGVASDMFNEYRSDKLSPYIAEINKYHNWTLYLFYGLIASFAFQVYALKNKVCSKEAIIGICTFVSVILLFMAFKVLYACDMGTEVMMSTETFGLLGASSGYAMQSTIGSMAIYLLILFFLHYFHNRWINQYYLEPSELDIEETKENVMKNEDNSDEDKFDNLRKLKELLDSGILTQEEFDTQKKQILNS